MRNTRGSISYLGYITYINTGTYRGLRLKMLILLTEQSGQLEVNMGNGY